MELTRSNLVASGAPTSFWSYAVSHLVDILNRTTGPPRGAVSSYEALTGTKPRVMPILPFGCSNRVQPTRRRASSRVPGWV
eukprot:5027094-Pleurochrysis_carterae.AAC.1